MYGPPSLKVLAAEALNKRLARSLHGLVDPPPAPLSAPMSKGPASVRRRQRPTAITLPSAHSGPSVAAVQPQLLQAAPATGPPPSPALLSPRTPNLQAGRAPAHRADATSRMEVEEGDLLLPGMVGGGMSRPLTPTPSGQQPQPSPRAGDRPRSSAPLVSAASSPAALRSLEVVAGSGQLPTTDGDGHAGSLHAEGPGTPAPAGGARGSAGASAGSPARGQQGSGEVEADRLGGDRAEVRPGSGDAAGQGTEPALVSGSRGVRQQPSQSRGRVGGDGRDLPTQGSSPNGDRASAVAQDIVEAEVQAQAQARSGGRSIPGDSLAVESGALSVQDAAAQLLESTRHDEVGPLPTKPPRLSSSPSASTRAQAVDGFEVSSMDNECGICLENVPTIAVRPCKHLVCGECYRPAALDGNPLLARCTSSKAALTVTACCFAAPPCRHLRAQDVHDTAAEAIALSFLPSPDPWICAGATCELLGTHAHTLCLQLLQRSTMYHHAA